MKTKPGTFANSASTVVSIIMSRNELVNFQWWACTDILVCAESMLQLKLKNGSLLNPLLTLGSLVGLLML